MSLRTALRQRATQWARQITTEAKAILGARVKYVAVKSTVKDRNGQISVETTASNRAKNQWGVIRVARVFEQGSGIHGSKRRTYVIKPRLKKVLSFPWSKVDESTPSGKKLIGVSDSTGNALLRYVDHPGSAAINGGKGYMKPAIAKVRRSIRKDVPADIRNEVIGAFRRKFK